MKTKMTIVLAALALTACGQSGLSGTYGTQEKNDIQFVFSGDQVTVTKSGDSVTGKYKLEDKKLTVLNPQGEGRTFKIDDNGCLYDGGIMIGGKACKQ